jgi:hypothetical protein
MVIERARVSLREYSMRRCPGLAGRPCTSTVADPGDQGCRAGDSTGTNAPGAGDRQFAAIFSRQMQFPPRDTRPPRCALAKDATGPSQPMAEYASVYSSQAVFTSLYCTKHSLASIGSRHLCHISGAQSAMPAVGWAS